MTRLGIAWVTLLIALTVGSEYKRICYYTNWSQYRNDNGKFTVQQIDPALCTHIIFAFARLEKNILNITEWNDNAAYADLMRLKTQQPDLKILVSVGGARANLEELASMLVSHENRMQFISSVIIYLRQYDLDGLDLDFEYPAKPPSPPEDRERFTLLVQEMWEAFADEATTQGRQRLLLTAAVTTYKPDVDRSYEADVIGNHVDWLNLLTYDYHGPWDTVTGHNAPLYERSPTGSFGTLTNVNYGTIYWLRHGVPKRKIVIGIPAYGRGFLLADQSKTSLGSPTNGSSPKEPYTMQEGYMAYYEVCRYLKEGATVSRSVIQRVPYLYQNNVWIGYDDMESLKEKVRWLKELGLGGYMVWDISLDDFSGTFCDQGKYPLLKALKEEIIAEDSGPISIPSYLTEKICGPCVEKESGFDCDKNNASMYHDCMGGLVVHSASCPPSAPAFSTKSDQCVNKALLENEEPCEDTLKCGRAPEATFLLSSGLVNGTSVEDTSTDGSTPDGSDSGNAGSVSYGFNYWQLMLISLNIAAFIKITNDI